MVTIRIIELVMIVYLFKNKNKSIVYFFFKLTYLNLMPFLNMLN